MKKYLFVLLLVALLVSGCGQTVSAKGGRLEKVNHVVLPEDSYYLAHYSAYFCNLGQCWSDNGEYENPLLGFFVSSPRVYTSYLRGDRASLTLAAKPGWNWVYDEGSFFSRPSWVLERDSD